MREKIKIEIRAQVHDKNGRLIKSYPWKRSNTLLRQFIQILVVQLNQETLAVLNVSNASVNVTTNAVNLGISAPAGTTTYGIKVGTGTADVAMTDVKLGTQVTTNVAHGVCSATAEAVDSTGWRAVITRSFTNNTGALLSITEVGLYCIALNAASYFCIDRTLYNVSVPSGSAVTLTYRITVSL